MKDEYRINDIRRICVKAYNLLNGEINNVCKSAKIEFPMIIDNEYIDPKLTNKAKKITGVAKPNSIFIDLYSMKYLLDLIHINLSLTDDEEEAVAKGLIVSTIAHELSHLDQKHIKYIVNGYNNRRVYEYGNEKNTRKFLKDNYSWLEDEFGRLDFAWKHEEIHNYDKDKELIDSAPYYKIDNLYDVFNWQMISLFNLDGWALYKECINKLDFDITIAGYRGNIDIAAVLPLDIVYDNDHEIAYDCIYDFLTFLSDYIYTYTKFHIYFTLVDRDRIEIKIKPIGNSKPKVITSIHKYYDRNYLEFFNKVSYRKISNKFEVY